MEETTIAEDVSQRGAQVRASTLPVVKGAILQVAEIGGDCKTRAEVRNISIGQDGQPAPAPAVPRRVRPRSACCPPSAPTRRKKA